MTIEPRTQALIQHLCFTYSIATEDFEPDSICDGYCETALNYESEEYLVLDDDEREAAISEYIKETLWAFNADFLQAYTPDGVDANTIRIIQEKYEDGNEALWRLCGFDNDEDFASFVSNCVSADGYGHFLNRHDGNEDEQVVDGEYFYIYRTN